MPRLSCILLVLALSASPALAQDRLVTLEGKPTDATIASIDAAGVLHFSNAADAVDLQTLRRIERPLAPGVEPKPVSVYLAGGATGGGGGTTGAVLLCTDATTDGKAWTVSWKHGSLKFPMEAVRAVCYMADQGKPDDVFAAAIADKNPTKQDKLFALPARGGKKPASVGGLVKNIEPGTIGFAVGEDEKSLPRARLYGVVMAQPDATTSPDRSGQVLITMIDGAALWGTVLDLKGNDLRINTGLTPSAGTPNARLDPAFDVTVPWDSISRLDVRSNRLAFLSDLTPVKVDETTPYGDKTPVFPWKADASCTGSPLVLAGKVYEKGLGVHSRSALTFANAGFNQLTATIGIDDRTLGKPQADCDFVVLDAAAGKELFRQALKGTDGPQSINVKITGVKQVTVLVDFGKNWDIADHADWCDARFIK